MKDYIKQGDCLELMKDIPDKSVDMILCDLPYGTTACQWDVVIPFNALRKQYNRIIKDNGAIVLFGSQPFTTKLISSNIKNFRYEIIWEKQQGTNPMFAKKGILKKHENICVFYKKQPTYNPQMSYGNKNYSAFSSKNKKIGEIYGDLKSKHRECNDGSRYPTSILKFNTERTKLHPTQKPVALCEYLIKTYTNEGDIVFDSCMGSGTTCIAAQNTHRHYIGFEKNEKYFSIAKKQIEDNASCERRN